MKPPITLYAEYEAKMQRQNLFHLLSNLFPITNAMYPGSYIHISPSFYFPRVVYIDSDRKAKQFFADQSFLEIIHRHKTYPNPPEAVFYGQDYTKPIPESLNSFDLLISQYAGLVSMACGQYLKIGGWIVANNSHGDAGILALEPNYKLVGVINFKNHRFYHSQKHLGDYFIPKTQKHEISKAYLISLKKGIGYTKTATHYIFQKLA